MAELIQDKLYQVSIGSRWNFSFIHAKDEEDLIRYLAKNHPNKDEIYGAAEILTDGTTRTAKIISHPLFHELYAQNETMGMSRKLPAGITMIDGKPWAVMLPTGGLNQDQPCHWNDLMAVTQENDVKCHYLNTASWCQENLHDGFHVQRGMTSADNWYPFGHDSLRSEHVGYRPVLMPLDPETFEPRPSMFLGREDGDMFSIGTLYMDGLPVANPEDPSQSKSIPDYVPGAKLHIGNSTHDIKDRITWIRVGDVLIADRNLMKNISWNDLDAQGLVRGPEHLQQQKEPLDHLMENARNRASGTKIPSRNQEFPLR